MKLTIVVTVLNERDTIVESINQAKALNIEKQIIVVDNCSTDGTREILQKLNDKSIEIVYQSCNYGCGRSILTGMNNAKGEYLYVHNSDLEYDPKCVYEMLELSEKEGLDCVFGSRLLSKAGQSWFKIIRERPFYLGTLVTTALINLFYGTHFTDIIGNRFYRVATLKKLNPQNCGVGFDFEVASKLLKYGFKAKEIGIDYKPRTRGKKIKPYHIIPAIGVLFKIKFGSSKPL